VRTNKEFLSQSGLEKDDLLIKNIVEFHNVNLDLELSKLVKNNEKEQKKTKNISFINLTEEKVKSFTVLEFIAKFDK